MQKIYVIYEAAVNTQIIQAQRKNASQQWLWFLHSVLDQI